MRRRDKFALRICLLCGIFLCATLHAQEEYTLGYVYDGDTVEIKQGAAAFKLRLLDIDAPERNQPDGLKSRRMLLNLCKHSKIAVVITGQDKYLRYLGKLQCNGKDASLYLVETGYAWLYEKETVDPWLKQAYLDARRNQIGLWQQPDPVPPWLWRKRHMRGQASAPTSLLP